MGRIGFMAENSVSAAALISDMEGIELIGVLSHFPKLIRATNPLRSGRLRFSIIYELLYRQRQAGNCSPICQTALHSFL